jgi:PP-loop superfamily ATP-utilizing enzyme
MTGQLDALLERLEQIALGACVDDPEQPASALAERQTILTAIAAVDPSPLSVEERARVKQRLMAIEARDRAMLADLEVLREELQKAMEQLTSGRAAVRGYGGQSGAPPPQVRRIG